MAATDAGLINTAPGLANAVPGSVPAGSTGPGSPVTGYNPASATASTAKTSAYTPNPYNVTPNMTAASQIKDIIASGSPLMQQAEASAKNMMNQRGLINSSQAITAGQSAVIGAATPIAQQDAATYATAGTNTVNAQNAALAADAAAKNTAGLQDATQQTSTSQYNAGQENASLAQASGASNQVALQGQQNQAASDLAKQQQASQAALQTQQIGATSALQAQQNAANLQNIQANGAVNVQLANINNTHQTLLQTSQGAATLYNQALANLSAIVSNANLSADQKATALNDGVAQLNDALSVLGTIAGIPGIQSTLDFTNPGGTTPATPGTTPVGGTPVPGSGSTPVPGDQTQTPGMIAAKNAGPRSGTGNSPIQDISQALAAGKTITDAQWARAGFAPGGAALPAGTAPQPSPLSSFLGRGLIGTSA